MKRREAGIQSFEDTDIKFKHAPQESEEIHNFRQKSITVSFDPSLLKNVRGVPTEIKIQKLTTLKPEF